MLSVLLSEVWLFSALNITLQYLLQQVQHVFMGDFFNGAGAVFFRKVFVNSAVILHAVEVVGRMADAVEVTAEADMVIVAHEVQHIVDVAVNAFDAGVVIIMLQKLTGKGNTDEAVIFIDCQNLLVI